MKVTKTELVEVSIPASPSIVNFPLGSQYANLEKGKVFRIEAFTTDTVTKGPTSGKAVISPTQLKDCFLETYSNGKLLMNRMPLSRLVANGTSGFNNPMAEIEPFNIDLANSKIVLSQTNNFGSAAAILLLFYYE